MEPEPNLPPLPNSRNPNDAPPIIGAAPPPLSTSPVRKSGSGRNFLVGMLSLGLAFFLADAVLSLADDSLVFFFHLHGLSVFRALVSLPALVAMIAIYVLMAFAPAIPKRQFLPLTLYYPAAMLLVIPPMIYFHRHMELLACLASLGNVIVGFGILCWLRCGFSLHWPLVPPERLNARGFSWKNLAGFAAMNAFILLPGVVIYLFFCVGLAFDHFTNGFMALHRNGFTVTARKYVRADGKSIELYPMAHVGEADFYQKISQSFPTNSLILMEGVTDEKHLLTNKISYKRMARTLGLSEQHEEFEPKKGTVVSADVDISQFSTNTINFLNMAMLFHSKGPDIGALMQMAQYKAPPDLEQQLFADILYARNRHLLGEVDKRLKESDSLVLPWGVAHMPGISEEIEKSGFHLAESHEYTVIRFGKRGERKDEPPRHQDTKGN